MPRWEYGVTSVLSRVQNGMLHKTLASLAKARFNKPRLFIDDVDLNTWDLYSDGLCHLPITLRSPRIDTAGNWHLSALELYLRNPHADRYAIFQDDLIAPRNLRLYLDRLRYERDTYWNLYLFPANENIKPDWLKCGWYPANQKGLGAVGLVFDNMTIRQLLTAEHLIDRRLNPKRGHRAIDGGIVDSLRKAGVTEHVHYPALIQHTGDESSMGNRRHPKARSFVGEDFDCMKLLEQGTPQ